jgi:hypothetical protein
MNIGPTDGAISVLLVEDNPGDRRLIELTLAEDSQHRFSVRSADRLSGALADSAQRGSPLY